MPFEDFVRDMATIDYDYVEYIATYDSFTGVGDTEDEALDELVAAVLLSTEH